MSYFIFSSRHSHQFSRGDDKLRLISDISGNEYSKTALKHVVCDKGNLGCRFDMLYQDFTLQTQCDLSRGLRYNNVPNIIDFLYHLCVFCLINRY